MAQALVVLGAIALLALMTFLTVATFLSDGITVPVVFAGVLILLLLAAVMSALGAPSDDD